MLEQVFSNGHELAGRIFYDVSEGQYYDKATDLYLSLDDVRAFGIPC